MFENLLVAVNGSPCADRALELAVMLAKAEGSKLVICSVANPSALYGQPPAVVELALEQIRDDARHAVNQALGKARAAGVTAEGCLLDGGPAYEIVLYAGKIHADAIVIGTHGRSGLKRLFMGSVAEGVLRAAAMPVFTVRESQHMPFTPESVAMKAHILVPIDGSENALRALEVARDFAASLDAQLIVCHVVDLSKAAALSGGEAQLVRGCLEELQSEGEAILAAALEHVSGPVSSRIAEGAPVNEIDRLAAQIGPGFVVIGSHGRTGLSRAVMGSVAEGVVRGAPIPVLVVPSKHLRAT